MYSTLIKKTQGSDIKFRRAERWWDTLYNILTGIGTSDLAKNANRIISISAYVTWDILLVLVSVFKAITTDPNVQSNLASPAMCRFGHTFLMLITAQDWVMGPWGG